MISAWALAFANWETEPAALMLGFPSRPDLEADGVSGGEWTVEWGGDGRGEGAVDPAGMCRGSLEWEGTCHGHVSIDCLMHTSSAYNCRRCRSRRCTTRHTLDTGCELGSETGSKL